MIMLGISGSLRKASYNSALLRAASELMPAGASLEIADLRGIPLYDGDLEAELGLPAAVQSIKERIARCDGLILATPEYNNGMPGVFKNAIDWASRPASDIPHIFGGKKTALIGASPGGFGTILAQNGWLPVMRTLGMQHWTGGRLLVSGAGKVFENGTLVDDTMRERLRAYLTGFAAFVAGV